MMGVRAAQELQVTDDSEFLSIEPWPVSELAGHLIAQVTLGRRALIESDPEGDAFERETDRFELEAWARLELTAWLTAAELDSIGTPIGSLDDDQLAICERGLIVASTIGWAVDVVKDELPPLADGEAEMQTLDWAPTPWTPVRQVSRRLRVRPDEDLARERERWEILVWRTTLFEDPEFADDDKAAWRDALIEIDDLGLWPTSRKDILIVSEGLDLGVLPEDQMAALRDDAETRLRTLNWVCGYGERPSSAPLDLDLDASDPA